MIEKYVEPYVKLNVQKVKKNTKVEERKTHFTEYEIEFNIHGDDVYKGTLFSSFESKQNQKLLIVALHNLKCCLI